MFSEVSERLEAGFTLPAGWYSDGAILALERERIFKHTWQYACVTAQVENFEGQPSVDNFEIIEDADGEPIESYDADASYALFGLEFTNDDGDTFVLRAGTTFEILHVNRIGETTLASPALVDGRWYIRTNRNLYAIGR